MKESGETKMSQEVALSKQAVCKRGKKSTSPYDVPVLREHMWRPGQSGNPKGRAPKPDFRAILERHLKQKDPNCPDKTIEQAFCDEVLAMARKGNRTALTEVMGRLYGSIKQQIELTGSVTLDVAGIVRRAATIERVYEERRLTKGEPGDEVKGG